MAKYFTSFKLSYDNAVRFRDAFSDAGTDANYPHRPHYIFIGNDIPYANSDTSIPDISDSEVTDRSIWANMFAAKKVVSSDVELVIPRRNWSANTTYKSFDDTISANSLVTTTNNTRPMYVITDDLNVYLCVHNDGASNSTIKPTGTYLSNANGFIDTPDNYVWKYMYNVKPSNKFLTEDWIPVPTSVNDLEYSSSTINLLDGAIAEIVVSNSGTGYVDSIINVAFAFASGCNLLTLDSTDNVKTNMYVSGSNVVPETYITNVDTVNKRITLSINTIGTGGGTGYKVNVFTRVAITGDGSDDYATAVTLANTGVSKIRVTSRASGYSYANVSIYGSGNNATARAVLAPKFGHGFNPARELAANNAMVSTRIGAPDSTEGGIISVDTSFRQYGLLAAPHKYGSNSSVDYANANSVISQTTDISVIPGSAYIDNEIVYQGTSLNNFTFKGTVHVQESNTIRLINVFGTPTIGSLLKGNTSLVQRAVEDYSTPEFEPGTGDIIFVKNDPKTDRADGQAENIRLTINF